MVKLDGYTGCTVGHTKEGERRGKVAKKGKASSTWTIEFEAGGETKGLSDEQVEAQIDKFSATSDSSVQLQAKWTDNKWYDAHFVQNATSKRKFCIEFDEEEGSWYDFDEAHRLRSVATEKKKKISQTQEDAAKEIVMQDEREEDYGNGGRSRRRKGHKVDYTGDGIADDFFHETDEEAEVEAGITKVKARGMKIPPAAGAAYLTDLVGKRVEIWWNDDECWYSGHVADERQPNGGKKKSSKIGKDETVAGDQIMSGGNGDPAQMAALEHQIMYDDGEEEWIQLSGHRWRLEKEEPPKKRRAKKTKAISDDDEDFEEADGNEDDEDDEDDEDEDEGASDGVSYFDGEDEAEAARKKKEKEKKKPAASFAKSSRKRARSIAKSKTFKKYSFSTKQPPYIDPCGMDTIDRGVEIIVQQQVRTVRELLSSKRLVKRMQRLRKATSSTNAPSVRLQTACSGTDAPAIALALVEEAMTELGQSEDFSFEHVCSCESEPFKQAYITRNFPGVPVYPDITKLCDDDTTDVYGAPKPVPDGDLFVAGTVCKDFSGRNWRGKKDLDDGGKSGETFFAAVECLNKFKPKFSVFENVKGAPWVKMQEYITGRVSLSAAYEKTMGGGGNKGTSLGAGSSKKKEAGVINELTFVPDSDGKKWVVAAVPKWNGVRKGATLEHVLRGSNEVRIKCSKSAKKATLKKLMEDNGLDKKQDVLVFRVPVQFETHVVKVSRLHV
jgi:hypothetical protein